MHARIPILADSNNDNNINNSNNNNNGKGSPPCLGCEEKVDEGINDQVDIY